ncbi:MAG: carboxypeptidase regulatory-like domain-containing protein [Kouleothrix sp.]|nr:carboxypeptidase regulatory-like domain-containing protein [Kouleothrix sp.]
MRVRNTSNKMVYALLLVILLIASIGSTQAEAADLPSYIKSIQTNGVPYRMALNPNTNRLYVTTATNVTVIDSVTENVIAEITLPRYESANGVAVNRVTNRFYVSTSNYVEVYDGSTNAWIKTIISQGDDADAIAVNSLTNKIFVAHPAIYNGYVDVIDGGTDTKVARITTGVGAYSLVVDESSDLVYAANTYNSNISVIAGSNNTVISTINVNPGMERIALDSTGNRILVTYPESRSIGVYDASSGNQLPSIAVQSQPKSVLYNPATKHLIVASFEGYSVPAIISYINDGTETSIYSPYNSYYHDILVNQSNNRVYIANGRTGTVEVIQDTASVPAPTKYAIKGHVSNAQGNPLANVTISAGLNITTSTDNFGNYSLPVFPGNYTLIALLSNYNFLPKQRDVSITNGEIQGQDFTGSVVQTLDYIALGDSVAAGHGLTDNAKSDPDFPCRRSPNYSYPGQLTGIMTARGWSITNFVQLACSGATSKKPDWNWLKQQGDYHPDKWFTNQVDEALKFLKGSSHKNGRPVLVTVTLGADDFPWTSPLAICGLLNQQTDGKFKKNTDGIISQLVKNLNPQVKRLLSGSKDVSIVFTGYYNPFNKRSVIFQAIRFPTDPLAVACIADGTRRSDDQMYQRTEYIVNQINLALAADVVAANSRLGQIGYGRLTFAGDIKNNFIGHEAAGKQQASDIKGECGYTFLPVTDSTQPTSYTWVQYPSDNDSYSMPSQAKALAPYSTVTDPNKWRGDCFHPNRTGSYQIALSVDKAALRVNR